MIKSVSGFSFETFSGNVPLETASEVIKIWKEFGGLDEAESQRRLQELVLVSRNESGNVIGISTAVKTYFPQIQNYVYVYRCLILPKFRAPALDTQMIVKSKNFLAQRSKSETENKSVGIMVIVQNEAIKRNWRQAVWAGADMLYVGNTPKGDHIRIGYFKQARI